MNESQAPYTITIDLIVLDHLSEGLYSSVAAVLTEAVANAWDADATKVSVDLDLAEDVITIADDGIGMNRSEMNEQYLRVGYRKRKEIDVTLNKERPVMGRKGIGKLSLFSIADEIRIESRKEGYQTEALKIIIPEMREAIEQGPTQTYEPKPVPPKHEERIGTSGTVIELNYLKKDRLKDVTPVAVRRRLARRFSVIGSKDFSVSVNGHEVSPNDREDIKFSQYIWRLGETEIDTSEAAQLVKVFNVDDRDSNWEPGWRVKGWIGTVDRPRQLSTPEGNLNSLVVMARGRLVDEDILPRVSTAEIYTKYITGQIEADFLDDSSVDIVTTDRQSLREDDERVLALQGFLKARMREIASQWSSLRVEKKADELRKSYPKIDTWLDQLQSGWRNKAEAMLGRIASMDFGQDDENEKKSKATLIRNAIFGFERLRLRGNAEELTDAVSLGSEAVLRLLADRDSLEAAHYRDIVMNRLQAIREFEGLVDANEKEKVLQGYLFDHLWLLDPAWDRASGDEAMEERLKVKDPFRGDDETKEKYGRVDIRYRTVAGKHMIVELKRVNVTPSAGSLVDQVTKYVEAFREIEGSSATIEPIIVVGQNIPDAEDALRGIAQGVKVVTYDHLIKSALQSYGEYLNRTKDIDFIDKIMEQENES